MADKANCTVVVTYLEISFLGYGDDNRFGQQSGSFPSFPDLIADDSEGRDHGLSSILY